MSGKDEFKFDEDAFPETDLSATFPEGEQPLPEEPEYPMTIKKAGGSRTRLLLLLLLLVVAVGGGAFYSLTIEEPAPAPPSPKKVVAVVPAPPPPRVVQAQASVPPPAVPSAAAPVAPASVSVAPPQASTSPQTAPSAVSSPTPPAPVAAAVPSPPKPAAQLAPAAGVAVSAKPVTAAVPSPPKPAAAQPAPTASVAPPAKPAEPKPVVTAVTGGGPWQVEAGTYLNSAALKAVEAKIRALGYEPQVSTAQKNVRMIRLRIGTVAENQVKETLALARTVVPEAFAVRSGAMFAIYAGTFANPENLRQLSDKLAGRGFSVVEEPVEVPRTLSLVRFGGFADQSAATEAANRARRTGIAADVVKPR